MQRYAILVVLLCLLTASTARAQAPHAASEGKHVFTLSKIDEGVVKEFRAAWRRVGSGIRAVESVVLIFRNADGSYRATSAGFTNEFRRFTFTWNPEAIAIIHTHPKDRKPEPHEADMQLADRLGVPVITITLSGMYVYDPITKSTIKVKEGLDWLNATKWAQD
jgi:hypothetical protein